MIQKHSRKTSRNLFAGGVANTAGTIEAESGSVAVTAFHNQVGSLSISDNQHKKQPSVVNSISAAKFLGLVGSSVHDNSFEEDSDDDDTDEDEEEEQEISHL